MRDGKAMKFKGNFIGGRFILPSAHSESFVSEDPGNLDHPLGEWTASPDAIPSAVAAAREAFPKWRALGATGRGQYLLRFQRTLKKHEKNLALLISREMGKVLEESRGEVSRMLAKIDISLKEEPALLPANQHEVEKGIVGRCHYRPRGVLAILSPFNLPAYLASSHIFPALYAGNTVVLKPSEVTPFVGQFLADLWKEAGIPKGVFNLLQGGSTVGRALVAHSGIDGVIFTGSWETGSNIQKALLEEPEKICALEMGGKNASIVLKDADLPNAVEEIFKGVFLTTGQRCNSTSRIILEASAAKKFLGPFLKKVDSIRIGYSTDPGIFMGPAASQKGLDRVIHFIEKAPFEGFEAVRKGGYLHPSKRGYYLKPSVHLKEGAPSFSPREGTYTDEEIFGPDAAIYIVRDLEEALWLNNRSRYGLVASVFSRSRKSFEKFLSEAETGIVNWNVGTTRSSARLPFGGLKRSGNNRPAGSFTPYLCTIPTASLEKK